MAPPQGPSVHEFLSNAYNSALNFGSGIVKAVTSPVETAKALGGLGAGIAEYAAPQAAGLGTEHEKYVDALLNQYKDKYGSIDAIKHAMYTDPVGVAADLATLAGGAGAIAKGAGLVADIAGAGRAAQIAGTTAKVLGTVADVADPLKLTTTAVGKAAGIAGIPERIYVGALRPGVTNTGALTLDDLKQMAGTGLKYAAPVTQKGVDTVWNALQDLNQEVTKRVGAGTAAGQTISRDAVINRLGPTFKQFAMQVAPDSDIRDITRVGEQFERTNAAQIPVATAQAKKVGTYQQIAGKYGKLSDAEVEAQKALARGLKDELVQAMPELGNLNAQESRLLDLQGVIEKAVNKQALAGRGPLNTILTGTMAGAATHSPTVAAAWMMKNILNDPAVRSRVAIALDRARIGTALPQKLAPAATSLSRFNQYQQNLDSYLSQ